MTRQEATAYWKQRSEHIHNWLKENEDVDFIGEYVEAIDMAIEALSAEAVQGEWIFNGYEKTNKSWFECSVCGSDYFHKHNFCPNCGAKMKGGDTE